MIEIPKYIVDMCKASGCVIDADAEKVGKAIANGTPLPEHHGRLIDVDEYYIGSFNDAREFLCKASTIIPATKEDKQTERKCASCIYHDERGGCLDSCAICRYTPKQTATKEGE